jgi:hypothetical protein
MYYHSHATALNYQLKYHLVKGKLKKMGLALWRDYAIGVIVKRSYRGNFGSRL